MTFAAAKVQDSTYLVHHRLVPRAATSALRRRLLLEIRRCGLDTADMAEWSSSTWWPSLRDMPEVLAVVAYVRGMFPGCLLAEPQILVRLPDEDDTVLGPPHLDDLPPWALETGARYLAIVGVELTDTPRNGGGTVVYPHGADGPAHSVFQFEGDALQMGPDLLHSGSPNHSADIRMSVFFRFLTRDDD